MLDHVEEIYHDGIMITKEVNVLNLVGEDVKEISTIYKRGLRVQGVWHSLTMLPTMFHGQAFRIL
jgi:hypothetical protein